MLEQLATSKSQQDVSIFNGLTMHEQIRYVQELYRLPSLVSESSTAQIEIHVDNAFIGHFRAPQRKIALSTPIHRMLRRYYMVLYGLNESPTDIPTHCTEWAVCSRQVILGTANAFRFSSAMGHTTARSRQCIAYADIANDQFQTQITSYGRVIVYLEHTGPPSLGQSTLFLVLIRGFKTVEEPDTTALIKHSETGLYLISPAAINGGIGLMTKSAETLGGSVTEYIAEGY